MGCDIHPLLFVKDKYGQGWDFKAIPPRDRHYAFFGFLANVRGDGPAPIPPRGLPDWFDMGTHHPSQEKCQKHRTLYDIELSGEHTPSWLSLADMRKSRMEVYMACQKIEWGKYVVRAWDEWIELMDFYALKEDVPPENVVIVFDFDS